MKPNPALCYSGLNLWFENPLVFAADAELRFNANNKGITFNGPTNFGGQTLTVVSTSHTRFLAGSGGLSNGTLRHTTRPTPRSTSRGWGTRLTSMWPP